MKNNPVTQKKQVRQKCSVRYRFYLEFFALLVANGGCQEYHTGLGKGDCEAARREIAKATSKRAYNKATTD